MTNYKWLTMTLCLALFQVGCDKPHETAAVASSSVANATVLPVAPANRVSAKPSLPVTVVAARQQVNVSEVTRVDLALKTSLSTGRFDVRITPDVGLVVVSGELEQQLTISGAEVLPMSLELRADQPGKYYVNIEVVSPEQVEGLNRRTLAVVVIAGRDGTKTLSADSKAEPKKHVLPAQETVQ